MNSISEINRCLQHLFHYSNQPQQPSCIMSMKSYYEDFINFDDFSFLEHQLYQFEDLNYSNLNEPPLLDFQFEDDVVYQNNQTNQIDEDNFQSHNLDQNLSNHNNNDKCQIALIQLRNFRQSINKEIHIKQVPLDIFTRQITPKRSIPSLFDDEPNLNTQQKQLQNYKPLRERIQEKLSQKQIDKKQEMEQQVIHNRFSKATQNSASRYHSKSPQSQFTKEFKQKFNSINSNQNLQFNPDQFNNFQRQNSQTKTSLKSQKIKTDQTVKIRIDIQNFQENHKIQNNCKQEKENKVLTPLKSQSKINSQDIDIPTKNKKQNINNRSKSPNQPSKSPIKTPQKEQCKYVIVNFYQKKY
ncbi:unnamed protein product [Paramecium sonneborni]|uniref:Uncharacterized protein n=1 Tax=Paramecium sonneborni TaxID=65129 RepID=A0A8S1PMB2_9CILI|nr:unnamed protein product [Paramecium sonneborni]